MLSKRQRPTTSRYERWGLCVRANKTNFTHACTAQAISPQNTDTTRAVCVGVLVGAVFGCGVRARCVALERCAAWCHREEGCVLRCAWVVHVRCVYVCVDVLCVCVCCVCVCVCVCVGGWVCVPVVVRE